MKKLKQLLVAAVLMMSSAFASQAVGWPANYEGVMLQGFFWDSYQDTKWTNLESQADELSKYFSLIWVPNSGKCSYMGYMPQYWFTNHNSAFGSEQELLSMIKTFKAKGTGVIADCVINHRNGVSNWHDFPKEDWNGQTWSIGLDGICCNDEMAYAAGQPKPTGAYDTGENFDGCRDLDHTNANVQNNCKNYIKCLQEKYGYAGMRYDMVKGYGGQYTKIYNQYANVKFSVGEYWDGSYDAVKGWIEATGKTSAAFDFPFKYAVNEAFSSGDMTKLVWKANGTTDQPAGMIHFGYAQYAVTFIDNHDTSRDDWNKFNGNVVAANAFMLCSPGTPCVFLPHYKANKAAIQTLINIRNSVGVHNMSEVRVLRSTSDCYMAEVTGTKGKLVVKIGSAQVSPDGYSNSDIKATGNDYCVWTKTGINNNGGGGNVSTTAPANLYILGNLEGMQWTTNAGVKMTKNGNKFTADNVKFVAAAGETSCFFNLTDALGADWDVLNTSANRYGAETEGTSIAVGSSSSMTLYAAGVNASGCKSWKVTPGTYTLTADFSTMTVTLTNNGLTPTPDPTPTPTPTPSDMPAKLYILGNLEGMQWTTDAGVEMTKSGSKFTANNVKFVAATGETSCFFNLTDALGSDWDALNTSANRYGAETEGTDLAVGSSSAMTLYAASVNASGCKSWKVAPGTYTLTADFSTMTVTLTNNGVTPTPDPTPTPTPTPSDMPAKLYILGNLEGMQWTTDAGVEMTKNGNTFVAYNVNFVTPDSEASICYFNLTDTLGADWDELNMNANRYGAVEEGTTVAVGSPAAMMIYANNVNAMGCLSWTVLPGKYTVTADFSNMTIKVDNSSSVTEIATDDNAATEYYTLQGIRVDRPTKGMYIMRRGNEVRKICVK